jgi:hypothetical protein
MQATKRAGSDDEYIPGKAQKQKKVQKKAQADAGQVRQDLSLGQNTHTHTHAPAGLVASPASCMVAAW